VAETASGDTDETVLTGPFTYRGSEADARDFLDAVQARVSTVAVKVRWLGGSALWFDVDGGEVARVSADRPVLQRLIAEWARDAAARGRIAIEIADRD
jgi:hypothetical protein